MIRLPKVLLYLNSTVIPFTLKINYLYLHAAATNSRVSKPNENSQSSHAETDIDSQGDSKNFPKESHSDIPNRKELCRLMGVEYTNKSRMEFLRSVVIRFCSSHGLELDKSWRKYSMDTLWPLVKGCTSYMNRVHLSGATPWTRTTTQHVMRAICMDCVRNANSKERAAAKRSMKRSMSVSQDPPTVRQIEHPSVQVKTSKQKP